MANVLYPFGAPDRQAPTFAATIALAIYDRMTVVDLDTDTQNATINLTIDEETPDGALLIVNVNQDGTGYDVAFGTGMVGDTLAGVADDKDSVIFQYSKSAGTFRKISQVKTVDAA